MALKKCVLTSQVVQKVEEWKFMLHDWKVVGGGYNMESKVMVLYEIWMFKKVFKKGVWELVETRG